MDTELQRDGQPSGERRSYAHLCLESPPTLLGRRLRWSVVRRQRRMAEPSLRAARRVRDRLERRLREGGPPPDIPLLSGWGPPAAESRVESDPSAVDPSPPEDLVSLGEELH